MKHDLHPAHATNGIRPARYDGVTRLLHWLTAVLVLTLFTLAMVWKFMPRDIHRALEMIHVSLGVILTATIVARLAWGTFWSRKPAPAATGWRRKASLGVHKLLYVLIVVQAAAGLSRRWVRGHGVEFFGTQIPSPFAFDPSWRMAINWVHRWNAWLIIAVVAVHVGAALYHHFVLRDGLLRRMA